MKDWTTTAKEIITKEEVSSTLRTLAKLSAIYYTPSQLAQAEAQGTEEALAEKELLEEYALEIAENGSFTPSMRPPASRSCAWTSPRRLWGCWTAPSRMSRQRRACTTICSAT